MIIFHCSLVIPSFSFCIGTPALPRLIIAIMVGCSRNYFLQTLQVPPSLAHRLQYLQFLQALQFLAHLPA